MVRSYKLQKCPKPEVSLGRKKEPITLFKYSKVSSSFIQPFADDATTQQYLNKVFYM